MSVIERPFKLPDYLENLVEAEGVRYVGRADNLYFDSTSIRGKASLMKYTGSIVDWNVETDKYEFFISRGMPRNQKDRGYRGALVGALANKGIIIRDEFLDRIFGTIDEELMRLYKEVFPIYEEVQSEEML